MFRLNESGRQITALSWIQGHTFSLTKTLATIHPSPSLSDSAFDEIVRNEPCKLAFTGKNDGILTYADRSSRTTALLQKAASKGDKERKGQREREGESRPGREKASTKTKGRKPRDICCEAHRGSLEVIIIATDNECVAAIIVGSTCSPSLTGKQL